MGDKSVTQHLLRLIRSFLGGTSNANPTFFTGSNFDKFAFTASTCVDLRFNDPNGAWQFLGG